MNIAGYAFFQAAGNAKTARRRFFYVAMNAAGV
jgi:hypothetical protein